MKLKFIDLFAGIGGFHLILKELGHECVFASEMDSFCQKVYYDNFGQNPFGDINDVKPKDIPDFDILAAGFPCQPFSYAGEGKGFRDKVRGTLFFNVCEIISEKKPKMFILENVKGLKSHDSGKTLEIILESLRELGYTVYSEILDSLKFGLPQKRERWFCVGFDKDIEFDFPATNNQSKVLRDIVEIDCDDQKLSLPKREVDAIDRHFASEEVRVKHDIKHFNTHKNSKKDKHGVYSFLKPDGTLRFHVGDIAKTQIQDMYYCHLDSYAPAIIVAREPKMWQLRRKLSTLECKRLQGFPDDFIMDVSSLQIKKQLGNSVPIPVIKSVIEEMILSYNRNIVASRQSLLQV